MANISERLVNAFSLYAPVKDHCMIQLSRKGSIFNFISGFNCLYGNEKANGTSCRTYVIFPSISNPRWIFPEDKKYLLNAGNIVKPITNRSRLAWELSKMLASTGLNLSSFFAYLKLFPQTDGLNPNLVMFIEKELGKEQLDFILYTGVPGAFQKYTAQIMDNSGEILCFAKLSCMELGKDRLQKEAANLKMLQSFDFTYLQHPVLLSDTTYFDYKFILQTKPPLDFRKPPLNLSEIHLEALTELFLLTLKENSSLEMLTTKASEALTTDISDPLLSRTSKIIFEALQHIESFGKNKSVVTCFTHGDFSPWNVMANNSQLYLYDWELGDYRTPYWDILNYISHKEMLIDRRRPDVILANILSLPERIKSYSKNITTRTELTFNIYAMLFLVDISLYYYNYVQNKLKMNIVANDGTEKYLNNFTAMLKNMLNLSLGK